MLEALKRHVYEANLRLVQAGLVVLTWGNVSGFDKETGYLVIKPSGVPYETMKEEDMVVVDLNGNVIEGKYNPSSDTPTHIELYKAHPELRGIVHTHSTYATAFAQAGRDIPPYGTTHADAFAGPVPCARMLTKDELDEGYEKNTGLVILETFKDRDFASIPAVLLHGHGVFTWGSSPRAAVDVAITLEATAKLAYLSEALHPEIKPIPDYLLAKHHERKHGPNAYYGQGKKNGGHN